LPKAKLLARSADKLFTSARKQDLGSRRRVLAKLANDRETTNRLFDLAKIWSRKSGFTRIINLPARRGDMAKMARIEFVDPLPKDQQVKAKNSKSKKDIKKAKEFESKKKKNETKKVVKTKKN
jgi:large subunit ribosomal protein L17